jgi:undecaprenyl-diphosphatase
MDWWQAIILGLVEGLTEYLPVSSTGHLLVTQRLLGIAESDAANAYSICIQAGAIMAVLGLYRARVRQAFGGLLGRDAQGSRLLLALVVAFVPAAGIGFVLDDPIEELLFGLWPIVGAWAVGAIVILLVGRTTWLRPPAPPPPDPSLQVPPPNAETEARLAATALDPTTRQALVIGLAQCLALWPGTSRSLVTILAGVAVGLPLAASVEFSFLLGVLTLGAATAYKGLQHGPAMLQAYGAGPILLGFFTAWLSAVIAVRWMVGYLRQRGLEVFAVWRLLAAAAVAGLILGGVLTP